MELEGIGIIDPVFLGGVAGGFILWILEVFFRMAGSFRARMEFRAKGFLQVPSGFGWFRFLIHRQYGLFRDRLARFCFSTARLCLVGMLLSFSVAGVVGVFQLVQYALYRMY